MIYAKEKPEDAQKILGMDVWKKIEAKTGQPGGKGHTLYEDYRKIPAKGATPEQQAKKAELIKESQDYYANFQPKAVTPATPAGAAPTPVTPVSEIPASADADGGDSD